MIYTQQQATVYMYPFASEGEALELAANCLGDGGEGAGVSEITPLTITFEPDRLPRILKNLRQYRGLSQRVVAQALGLGSPATISHYENGKRSPSFSQLIALFELYGFGLSIKLSTKRDSG